MRHLSGLDATFLHVETPEMPMHVGALNLLEPPDDLEGEFIDAVKLHIAARMHLASIFTKKLALMPFDLANPVWVDDDDVDLDYHIRQITLPKPGTQQQLEAYVGRLHSSLLDRSRPLWEFYVFNGLQSGQVAFYSKIHHAALDGQGGVVLAQTLLDVTAVPREVEPPPPHDKAPYQPPMSAMVSAALRNTAAQCLKIVKGVPGGVKAAAGLLAPSRDEDGKRRLGWPKGWTLAPKTPLNVSITNQRVFATATIPLPEVAGIGKAFGATLNDAVLAIVSGALRRYLELHDALPVKSLVAALPISLRAEGNTDMNNQVSMMLLSLASDEEDPARRMRAIVKASAAMKRTLSSAKAIMPTDFPSLGVPWLMSGLVSLYGRSRLADALPPVANVVVSNVPGPRVPLFLAGARMLSNYPVSIVTHGLALNVTLQSYNGMLDFGLIACRRAVPDVRDFADCLNAAHAELLAVTRAMAADAAPVPVKPARKRATAKVSALKPAPAKRATAAVKADSNPESAPKRRTRNKAA
ncbi:MAG: wax ester/triacylglycerol synthase family O-acyltransferase [Pseudomonadota bacterium]